MKWKCLGSLKEAKSSGCSGIYLIVHKGALNRIVYVGVSVNVGRRMREHYEGYLRGNRTIYNVDESEDVYSLMSSYLIHNHIKEYKNLANVKKIWASTTITSIEPKNLLSSNQNFSEEWEQILHKKYLPNLCVWALPLSNYTYEKATIIESLIQSRIIKTFDLRGFFNLKDISILGKIENTKVRKINIDFDCLPDLDDASKIVIKNINKSTTPPTAFSLAKIQLQDVITVREIARKKRVEVREKTALKYRNNGKPWSTTDLEKLRVMVVEFEMTASEFSQHLGRAPRAVAKRIEYNDKLSFKKWRESIELL